VKVVNVNLALNFLELIKAGKDLKELGFNPSLLAVIFEDLEYDGLIKISPQKKSEVSERKIGNIIITSKGVAFLKKNSELIKDKLINPI